MSCCVNSNWDWGCCFEFWSHNFQIFVLDVITVELARAPGRRSGIRWVRVSTAVYPTGPMSEKTTSMIEQSVTCCIQYSVNIPEPRSVALIAVDCSVPAAVAFKTKSIYVWGFGDSAKKFDCCSWIFAVAPDVLSALRDLAAVPDKITIP